MVTVIKVVQLILALSILVLIHEFGHFFFARLFKIRVEKFYLFFNPGFSLFKYKPKNSDTEYGIGWLPLGGYCKIAGMIDENMDVEAMKGEPQPWEFRSRPAWQRFLVMFGGVLFNFILAIVISASMLLTWGDSYLKNSEAIYGVECNDLALKMGFKNGDKIISFNNNRVEKFHELQIVLIREQATTAQIIRDGEEMTINIDPSFLPQLLNSPGLFTLRLPFLVSEVVESSPNFGVLHAGDRLIEIDTLKSPVYQDIAPLLAQLSNRSEVGAVVLRGGERVELELSINESGMLGVIIEGDPSKLLEFTNSEYNLLSSLSGGAKNSVATVGNYLKELKLIFTPKSEAYKSVGSFITIGKIFPAQWDWRVFWSITSFLSIMLAVLNLLPIPALDGGHILFLLWEMITRRKPNDKLMEYAQVAGMLFLFAIMILAFGNDIYRLFK
ncbi:MAG: RIP metalloprotease RseP [Bacteroidales bacterium]